MPHSLFGRSFLLLAALVLLTTAAWLSLFRYLDAEPRAREQAQLAASGVNLVRAALLAAAPEKRRALFEELSQREGMRLLPAEPEDRLRQLPDDRFQRLVRGDIQRLLGPRTRLAAAVDEVSGFWVSFRLDEDDEDEFWLYLPAAEHDETQLRQWLLWAIPALGLALALAGYMASRLSRPLRQLAAAASVVGRGERPAPLPEDGARELGQLAQAFNTMAADLQHNEEVRSEILAGISHDLRTPLTRLRLDTEMSITDDATRDAMVADIEQMDSVIAQFMDYARSNSGEDFVPTALDSLLADLIGREALRQRPLACTLGQLPTLPVQVRAVSRALGNLIDNAWKYGANTVTLTAAVEGKMLGIAIDDDGPGIPEDQMERLRQPFTRLDSARSNASGTGLGLAIVERTARAHGGKLLLARSERGGLRACLQLPLSQP